MLPPHWKTFLVLLTLTHIEITHSKDETCSKDESSDSCSQLVVETLEGKVRGSFLKSAKAREFYSFRRIPYAEPPINERRFKLAERKHPWEDVLDATKSSKVCPQPEILHRRSQMSEDCLYLNVYTRSLKKLAPVIVYIHSGLYYFGSGHIDLAGPQYLMDKNVVLVTLNYRLGALGLASSKTIPGNLALKDIILALKWIQANIENFGGDASKLTIMGGMAASDLVISPLARDLFHRAVIMGEASTTHSKANNKELTKLLSGDMNSPWEKIIETCSSWGRKYFLPRLFFKPESEVDFGEERFFKKHLRALMASGEFAKVPIMIGMTKNEYEYLGEILYEDDYFIKDIHTNFEAFSTTRSFFDYEIGYTRSHVKNITNAIKAHYFKNRNKYNSDNKRYIGEALSDLYVTHAVNRFIAYTRKFKGNVFAYQFDYEGKHTSALGMGKDKVKGVFHGDDLLYILQSRKHKFFTSDEEYKMVEKMTSILAHFADTG